MWLLVAIILLTIVIIAHTLRAPKAPGREAFALSCLCALWWIACVLLRHDSTDYRTKLLLCELAWFGIMGAPLFWCLSLITYANGRHLEKRWHMGVIFGISTLFTLAALTNDWHHGVYVALLDEERMSFIHGWMFFTALGITYVAMALAWLVGGFRSIHARGIHRRQIWILLVAATLPWIGNIAHTSYGFRLFNDDPTPFIFAATTCFMLASQLLYELFILPPIGRDAIFAMLPDPVIVLDQQGRILELNPAAAQLPGIPPKPIGEFLTNPPELAQLLDNQWPSDEDRVEIYLRGNDKTYELSCQSLAPWGRAGARMMTLRDITLRKADELRLAALSKSLHDRLEENLNLQMQLKEEASRDHLTGLYNRRHAHEIVPPLLESRSTTTQTAIFLIDIDHFKLFNDLYGHKTGDDVLILIADLLQADLRRDEYAFRWGGEEFLVVLPGSDRDMALQRCAQWREILARQDLRGITELQMTFSAGLALCTSDTTNLRTLIEAADMALYHAKISGRNQTAVFGEYTPHSQTE